MSVQQEHTTVERHYGEPTPALPAPTARTSRATAGEQPTAVETLRRIAVVTFGLVQFVIGLRVLLLLVGAREAAPAVAWIVDAGRPLVAPFDGILREGVVHVGRSLLDLTAITAFVGWTLLEAAVLAVLGVFSRVA